MENKIEENNVLNQNNIKQYGINSEDKNKKIPTILVIEDEDSERMSLKAALEMENIMVDTACDGAEAENMVKKQFYDIIIVDYRLPDIDGLNLIKKIKTTVPDLMPIVVTAYSSIELAIDSMRNGAYDYIVKPLDIPNLLKIIYKIIKETEILLNSKQTLRNIVGNNKVDYVTDNNNIIVVTTPDTEILSDGKKNNLLKKIKSFFKSVKNYYWG